MIRIAEFKSRFGDITILRAKRTGALIYSQGGSFQSEADGEGISLVPYIHAIYGLLCQADSRDILMIGCGGGTLATMLSRSGRAVTVVDVNPQAFLLARRYFGLPRGIPCRVADGGEFLLSKPHIYDAIVLDAFAGDAIPASVQSAAFFQLARTRLNSHGCVFANVHAMDDNDNGPDRMAARMAQVWPDVRLLDVQGETNRNAIIMAGAVRCLKKPVLKMRPQPSTDEIDAELKAMEFRSWRAQN
jgi:spermidine synthase